MLYIAVIPTRNLNESHPDVWLALADGAVRPGLRPSVCQFPFLYRSVANDYINIYMRNRGSITWRNTRGYLLSFFYIIAVCKIRTICHARDLSKLAWSCRQLCLLCPQTREIYQALPCSVDFKVPVALWNPSSKTILSKCSLVWNKGPVDIWNDHKTRK